jgi:DNA-binding Xre family transcriptional regulator
MPVDKKMRTAIQDAMKAAGIKTQVELAANSGVRRPTITDLLSGKQKDVRLSTLEKIAKACNCSVGKLLGGK